MGFFVSDSTASAARDRRSGGAPTGGEVASVEAGDWPEGASAGSAAIGGGVRTRCIKAGRETHSPKQLLHVLTWKFPSMTSVIMTKHDGQRGIKTAFNTRKRMEPRVIAALSGK